MTRLRNHPEVYRVRGLGLCVKTNDGKWWSPLDQEKHGRNTDNFGRKVEPSDVAHLVSFRGAQFSNMCHHTQRAFFRAMADLMQTVKKDASTYLNWNPSHVTSAQ